MKYSRRLTALYYQSPTTLRIHIGFNYNGEANLALYIELRCVPLVVLRLSPSCRTQLTPSYLRPYHKVDNGWKCKTILPLMWE